LPNCEASGFATAADLSYRHVVGIAAQCPSISQLDRPQSGRQAGSRSPLVFLVLSQHV
jgi:hypothetical protein